MAADLPVPGQFPILDAQTQVPMLVGITVAFTIASTVGVGLRVYTRAAVVHAFGVDDATIAFAQILSIGVSAVTILQTKYALGVHVWMTTPEGNISQLKSLFAGMVLYNLSQIVTKISFLLQYRRIFTKGRTRTVCLWILVFLVVWGVIQEVLVGMSCIPVAVFVPSRQGRCINPLMVWYLTSIMNIVTDFIIFTTPMPAIRNLALKRKQKILVASIFGLGFFTCIISIVRLFTLRAAINTDDPTWDNVPTSYWTIVELNSGILCACLPTLRPLFLGMFPSLSNQSQQVSVQSERRQPRGVYTLEILADSKEELRAEYEPAEYVRHSGPISKLTTAVYGGRERWRGDEEGQAWDGWDGDRKTRVAREIGVKELTRM